MIIKANAKLNIALQITGVREDGYHLLDMVFKELDFGDEVSVEKISKGIELTCSDKSLPTDEKNIAYKAAKRMIEKYEICEGIKIDIIKRTPHGAGLGGGSSDAAAVIKGINEHFDLKLSYEEMIEIGVKLGADVPFFLKGGIQRAKGIGEELEMIDVTDNYYYAVVKPEESVSTVWAYKEFDVMTSNGETKNSSKRIEDVIKALKDHDEKQIEACIFNDLEAPVIKALPVISDIKNAMKEKGAFAAMMTGSGSAVFGMFKDKDAAEKCVEEINKEFGTNGFTA